MFAKYLLVTPLLLAALVQPAGEDKAKKDLAQMQGTWIMEALEINGKNVGPEQIKDTFLIVKDDEYRTRVKDKLIRGFRLKLDPSKDPKAVDMIQAEPGGTEKIVKGIYNLDGDRLKIARGLSADQERPQQFATWPNTTYFVVTWKKQTK